MKKVVFISGTSHSASTLLDLMLSNNPKVYSVGEVHAFFHPFSTHHINPICGCGKTNCIEWDGIKRVGKWKFYQEIFKRHSEVDTIIDSSKEPAWIKEQIQNLKSQDIKFHNLLIWKTPNEYAFSLSKRGKGSKWKTWLDYHTTYLSIVNDKNFRSVKTSDLLDDPKCTLNQICKILCIAPTDDQELYWNSVHHTLYGSAASRIHLHEPNSPEFKRLEKYIINKESQGQKSKYDMNKYRTIYKGNSKSSPFVMSQIEKNTKAKYIADYLFLFDVSKSREKADNELDFPYYPFPLWYIFRIIKRLFRSRFKVKTETYR